MILVTGATGTIGSEVVRLLARRGEAVRAMTRKPAGVPPPGVEVVRGDFDDPVSLAAAARGASTLFLLSAPGPTLRAHDLAMLAAAPGVRTVKLSAIGTAERAGSWHRVGEEAVRARSAAWTILRPSSFASNALRWADAICADAPVPNPTGDGAQGVVDPRDVALVAVEALTSTVHDGHTYTLTGPELLSVPDQATLLGEVLGRPVRTVEQRMATDSPYAEGVRFVRDGGNAVLTGDIARVLGRPPRRFLQWAVEHRSAFA